MAYTKVKAVKNHLHRVLSYATNEAKTGLDATLSYITNPCKTEQAFYQTALNCESVATAFEEMQNTKRKHKKTGGVLAYHFMQSFKPGEVTPKQAHSIGVEFANVCFGNRFEVVIGTHLDKKHLHNHIVINSVAFADGLKYHSSPASYYNNIRFTSDKLCKENGLSLINPQGQGKHYAEWQAEQEGRPTIRSQIRADIDDILANSFTFKSFLELMKKQGYTIRYGENIKYIAVKPPYSQKFIRLQSLGEDYTEESIKKKLTNQQQTVICKRQPPVQTVKKCYVHGKFGRSKKIKGFQALYFRYLYLLGKVKKRQAPYKVNAYLRNELLILKQYSDQFKFLLKHNIQNLEELSTYQKNLENQIQTLTQSRQDLYKKRRSLTDHEGQTQISDEIKTEIETCTAALGTNRFELRMCKKITEATAQIQKHLQEVQTHKKTKEELKHEQRSRSR